MAISGLEPLMAAAGTPPLRAAAASLHPPPRRTSSIRSSYSPPPYQQVTYKAPKPRTNLVADWVSNNDGFVRSLPIYVGCLSLLAVLLNRSFSGIAPVAEAGSSQSRADILTLALSVTDLLTGLVWLSIRPRYISPFKIGVAAESSIEGGDAVAVEVHKLIQGSLFKNVVESGKQNYLANLALYPGRTELPFLPTNTQAVILQPLGDKGIAIIGGDTIRGFNNLDQAWITLIAEKLEVTLSKS